ncbi:MAG: glycoside hydrolase family 3 C-terminal domain-containing protein, partial [Clostridia bacterium]|nr:glycoside hydrolase family 3 C-terminal domain-containing protein [Clostridia bacterium]
YLKAFEYCIKNAKPSAVMGAYNAVNGEPCAASKTLLKDILRDKFGFEGYVESDAGGVEDINLSHKLTGSLAESAAMSVNNGCDMCIGGAYESLGEAYEKGWISEETINESVTRLFEARFRLGMFADDCEYDNIPYEVVDCQKHKELNLKMAQESIVLLKNDGILPLDINKKIAVIGPNADDLSVLLANYNGTPSEYTTLLKGIQNNCKNVIYARGCNLWEEPELWSEKLNYEAIIAARKSDVIIMCMGLNPLMEGEEGDAYNGTASGDKISIELPDVQNVIYKKIVELGKPIVFVNVSGSCIALGEQDRECNAVVQCFYPGARGGEALANVLFGKCSPSGRLPVTFYKSDDDLPDFKDYSMKNRTYKYFSGTPVYPFGHGLTYSEILENWTDENTVEVINNGNFDTYYSVLQFEYIPHKSLKDFKKIFLSKGEKKVIKF